MELIDRQIKAVEETLEQVIKEYREKKEYHNWDYDDCPICQATSGGIKGCLKECSLWGSCIDLAKHEGYDVKAYPLIPPQDIAGLLKSLLVSLTEMKGDKK
ncbi:MAG TPA: hypothetical protein ENI13_01435 [candidate division CPR3 bacterium]|uniref:Uncharacterized protein n=1 Tax=candidate division CPR3 bacterium TaxID=2268181 RepID=A0A7C1NMI1_UNCC3|nr:hypothetical protein [candidate division CPR3 bacterium]